MAVLWFLHETLEPMRGFPAYQLPIQSIIATLGGERNFKFLSPLHKPPKSVRQSKSDPVADYRLVVLELDQIEAKLVKWRAGFYAVIHGRTEAVELLGEPNALGTHHKRDAT